MAVTLHPLYSGVYAVGHTALSTEGLLSAALLYAGPGAMLSHGTAAWWLGLTGRRPPLIHVSTPRQVLSMPGVLVHGRRSLERVWHRQLPVACCPMSSSTTPPRPAMTMSATSWPRPNITAG